MANYDRTLVRIAKQVQLFYLKFSVIIVENANLSLIHNS